MDPYTRRFTWDLIRSRRALTPAAGSHSGDAPFPAPSASGAITTHLARARSIAPAIILTTHSMEEAEALADDVVVLAEGKVAATGTPLQLRHEHGAGYTMIVSLAASPSPRAAAGRSGDTDGDGAAGGAGTQPSSTQQAPGMGPDVAAAARESTLRSLLQLVHAHIPAASLLPPSASGALASFPHPATPSPAEQLQGLELSSGQNPSGDSADFGLAAYLTVTSAPADSAWEAVIGLPGDSTGHFPALLRALDASKRQLGVTGYSLSETTLEEVFNSITAAAQQQRPQEEGKADHGLDKHALAASSQQPRPTGGQEPRQLQERLEYDRQGTAGPDSVVLHGWRLRWQQFRALLVKRGLIASRDRLALLTQLLVPLLLVYLALWVQGLAVKPPAQSPLLLSRATALRGAPTAVAAPHDVRASAFWDALLGGYGREQQASNFMIPGSCGRGADAHLNSSTAVLCDHAVGGLAGAVVDSGTELLWRPGSPKAGSLEGWLLQQWHSGRPVYDALFVAAGPNSTSPATLQPGEHAGPGLVFALLHNGSDDSVHLAVRRLSISWAWCLGFNV